MPDPPGPRVGRVYLVGAGPGDPGLLTLRGKEILERAEVVVYDRLASPRLLEFVAPGAERIYVGKKAGRHVVPQDRINAIIVEKAREGKTVVRLKGGDPFIFGRGGEEAQELRRAGIPYEIVPGVTSAIAVPAYAGIPLTHRAHTASVAFVTGHRESGKDDEATIDWKGLSTGVGTLVFLMGMSNLPNIVRRLVENGRPPETPVAVIRWGTTPRHRSVDGTLADIVDRVREAELGPPAVIVVGEVAGLRSELDWFEGRPLLGRRVLVTRTREQASELVVRLEMRGALCVECPTIAVGPPADPAPLDRAVTELAAYDWVVFSSTNAVRFFFARLWDRGLDARHLGRARLAAVGEGTAQALEALRLRVDLVPDDFRAEGLLEAFGREGVAGRRILVPRAEKGRELLPEGLRRLGAEVTVAPTYRTYAPELPEGMVEALEADPVDVVTFTSSSTVKHFFKLFPEAQRRRILTRARVACIGPVTAKTAEKIGLRVDILPEKSTIVDLVHAIEDYFAGVRAADRDFLARRQAGAR
ncbi:uroporphyrinogen-III C-methyltransferase [Dissulfurirhabdus thermomarina]|uniref:uroporphyrinogen-III C-methyltransferase n=1 Tax=Dissulfurirhabdus thermomarina TaxID=1765737 RepID=A0A6N9TNR8_DISTH|nr:uroporphyrinogen-III C-methyltransferase [Dissulfurirhabdus thermomarina]NDY42931.1 uroporphyrinogen-III C-methyltransferase [Dissulfurirhabdus thermomarina]NMX23215.1 uroporphyrinogen-III C-methyltransferase [Dissulfurirhabdus thermomarina]